MKWRHAGETGSLAVYSKKIAALITVHGILILIFWVLAMRLGRARELVTYILLAVFGPRTIIEGRRAIIFTPTEVIYRPAFASPLHVPLQCIVSVRANLLLDLFLLRPRYLSGVALTLTSGDTVKFPVDFKEQSEILRRLDAARSTARA